MAEKRVEDTLEESATIKQLQERVAELEQRLDRLLNAGSQGTFDGILLKAKGTGAVGRVYFNGTTGVTAERVR